MTKRPALASTRSFASSAGRCTATCSWSRAGNPIAPPISRWPKQVSIDELEPVWAEDTRRTPYGTDEETVRQLVVNKRIVAATRETTLLRSACRRRHRELLRALLRREHRSDRGRGDQRAVPQPRSRPGNRLPRARRVPRSRKRPDFPHGSAGRLAEGALPEARLRRDRPDLRVRSAGSQLVAIRSTPPFEGWVDRSPVRSQFE